MWWALAFLIMLVIAVNFIWLYRKAVGEGHALRQHALVLLMEEGAYLSQREALRRLVAQMDGVENPTQLWLRACRALDSEAQQAQKKTRPDIAAGLLWHMRNTARGWQ
jgi:hypothetical protein